MSKKKAHENEKAGKQSCAEIGTENNTLVEGSNVPTCKAETFPEQLRRIASLIWLKPPMTHTGDSKTIESG